MIAKLINESSRPTDEVRAIVEFVAAQAGKLERGSVAVKVVDGRGGGHAHGDGYRKPKWQGRYRFSIYLTIPPDEDAYAVYGLPRVCWHSKRAKQLYNEIGGALYDQWYQAYVAGERRFGRWPLYCVTDWREHLVHLTAHEYAHIVSYDARRTRNRNSEIQCELFAERILNRWRELHPVIQTEGVIMDAAASPAATLETTLHKRAHAAGATATSAKTATKTKTRSRRRVKRGDISAIAAAEHILRRAGKPLHVKEITKRILAMPETSLRGKTPEATVGAILAVAAKKPGSPFKRTAPSTYAVKPKK